MALSLAAIIWGCACLYSVLRRGPSGEWAVMAVGAAYALNIPAGVITLFAAVTIKTGFEAFRRTCFVLAAITLALPLLTSLISWMQRMR